MTKLTHWSESPVLGRLKTRTLRSTLLTFFTVLLGAISVSIYLLFPGAIQRQAQHGIETKAMSIGAMAAHNVTSAVLSEDTEGMEVAIEGAFQNDDVTYVEVRDKAGAVLLFVTSAAQQGRGQATVSLPGEDIFSHSSPVTYAGDRIGTLRLELSLVKMRAQVARAKALAALLSLAIFAAGFLAATAISTHVTSPLRQVATAAERIASGDFNSRAEESMTDEVGQMARSFNRMVDHLQGVHEELAVSKGRLEQVLDNIPASVVMCDQEGRYLYANPAAFPDPEDRHWVLDRTPPEYALKVGFGEEAQQTTVESVKRCVRDRTLVKAELAVPTSEGGARQSIQFFSPILAGNDEVTQVISYGLDITDLREAEAELKETQDRLLQAQKMESVGRLAGGVAHDFNNLLTTISGNADLILMDMGEDDPAREDVDEIHKAAQRASALTQQLLAFSRKQVSQPRALDLNETVRGIQKMLNRLIGEDVTLETQLTEDINIIKADPGQIEQVIVNLAVNARDAMPTGGVLTVRTENISFYADEKGGFDEVVPAGEYTMISVGDTGTGMDLATLERIFEPFFTMKEQGKGTGLGLATVYGIVRQSKGYMRVYSEVGMGTNFRIIFPRVNEAAEVVQLEGPTPSLARGTETILVAEDQEGVRNMVERVLSRCGYTVLSAEGPEMALELVEAGSATIDLVLTDVVMPGMSGPDLVEKLTPMLPDTPVIFMSGYTDDQLQHHGVLDEGVILIEKPFTAKSLAASVRAVLDGAMNGGPRPRSTSALTSSPDQTPVPLTA